MDILVGKPPIYRGGLFKIYGSVDNVSYNGGVVIEIPNFKSTCTIQRICVANVDNTLNTHTIVELFDKDPSLELHRWNRIYRNEFSSEDSNSEMTDDLIQYIAYMSDDGTDRIWLKITPNNGTSNKFEYFMFGREEVKA